MTYFIDGYNLFYGLLANIPYKWLDLPALLTHITTIENPKSKTAEIHYFNSPIKPELASRRTQSKEAKVSYILFYAHKSVNWYIVRPIRLFLDEIGECERAVTSLKYFAEKTPTYYIAASGSNIGLLHSFPVGKVEQHNLRPLTFLEFLYASQEQALIKAFETQANTTAAHGKLFDKLTDYYFTGGMPEAVSAWYQFKDASFLDRVEKVTKIHADLVEGYRRDFGK